MKISPFLFITLLFLSCESDQAEPTVKDETSTLLTQLNKFDLIVPEPSGLTLSQDKKSLYTISDETSKVYKLNLTGDVLDSFFVQADDLEGIAFNSIDNTLLLVDEQNNELIEVSTAAEEIRRVSLPLKEGSGPEGICFDSQSKSILIVTEKENPYIYKFDYNLRLIDEFKLDFAKDYSGLDYAFDSQNLWIISDQSQKLYLYNFNLGQRDSFNLNYDKAEGIAYDFAAKIIYIVTDDTEELYLYSNPL